MIRNFSLILISLVCFGYAYEQTNDNRYGRVDVEFTVERRPKKIYVKAEFSQSSTYRDSSLTKSIEKQLNQSVQVDKRAKKGKYLASVQFIMTRDSTISDVRCVNDPGFGMCQEVMRIVKKHTIWLPSSGRQVLPYRKSSITTVEDQ